MEIIAIGLDCKAASVDIREKLSFSPERIGSALSMLTGMAFIGEAAILSTCNRVEIYALSEHATQADTYAELRGFLSQFHELPEEAFVPYLFQLNGRAAVEHLFEVASGIQSMVVGESQILGQVRDAIDLARKHGGAGRVLDALFRAALSTGKRARTETAIGESSVSVSYTAVELLEQKAGSLKGKTALVVGGGKTAYLTGQILHDAGVGSLLFVNRTIEKAAEIARTIGSDPQQVFGLESLTACLTQADVVISCTSASEPIITANQVATALVGREEVRPLYMVDIAVPRDIEPEAATVVGANIFDIDDVKAVAEANLARRWAEVDKVRAIIQEELRDFMAWMGALAIVPTITGLRARADEIRKIELNRTMRSMGNLDPHQLNLLEELTTRIVNKLLHEPTLRLKEVASSSDAGRYAEVVQYLFSLQGQVSASN
jgi:glutamyl-tRNA reductase